MFGIFTGVIVNAGLVIIGGLVGTIFKAEKLKRIGERAFQAFAIFVMVLGISGSIDIDQPVLMLVCIAVGVAIGELLDVDKLFTNFGNWLQKILKPKKRAGQEGEGADSNFAEGFINASLLYCIGSMTFLGALESGLNNNHSIYITKGVIDAVSGVTLAMSGGFGVCCSALTVLVYQGLLTGLAVVISPLLTTEIIALCSTIGSMFLVAIALNMLGITKIKVANFLPAMFMPMLYQGILLIFQG